MTQANVEAGRRVATVTSCPVCESDSEYHMQAREGELRRCRSCGLIFAHPLALPESPQDLFGNAYSGREGQASMKMFHHRLTWRADLLSAPSALERVLPRTQQLALSYLQRQVPAGSDVLDIGCGSGLFMESASRKRYSVSGVEVAEPAVRFLERQGYRVFHGTVEQVPCGWADPAACTAFYVIHHVNDPMMFLRTIRDKFPYARLILTEHYLGDTPRKIAPLNLPPRRLTLWTRESLRTALELAGFAVQEISLVTHPPYHEALDGSLTALYCRARGLIPAHLRPHLIASYLRLQDAVSKALRTRLPANPNVAQQHLLAIATPAPGSAAS